MKFIFIVCLLTILSSSPFSSPLVMASEASESEDMLDARELEMASEDYSAHEQELVFLESLAVEITEKTLNQNEIATEVIVDQVSMKAAAPSKTIDLPKKNVIRRVRSR